MRDGDITLITLKQYKQGMKIIEELMQIESDRQKFYGPLRDPDGKGKSLSARTLRLLSEILERYEQKKYPIGKGEKIK